MGFLSRLLGASFAHSADAMSVLAGDLLEVVGESYRQDALRKVTARATSAAPFLGDLCEKALKTAEGDRERRWFRAALIWERNNPHDRNAIAIYADGVGQVGYLSREDAVKYRPIFEALKRHNCSVASCPAFLIGGRKDAPSYGVMLCLSSPKRIIADLAKS